MSQLRVVIDLGDEPDLYLQISAISAGVPQINMIETDYVTSNVNGLIIPSSSNMIQALDYFLLSLKNWNYSYASSIKLVDEFSSTKIIRSGPFDKRRVIWLENLTYCKSVEKI